MTTRAEPKRSRCVKRLKNIPVRCFRGNSPSPTAPHRPAARCRDAWLRPTPARADRARIEELVRIRRAERELARLNEALASLAAENGQLYERARHGASRTLALLRELQHRVRNNLAAIQALLVLERHRSPRRSLDEAIDVAIARIRGMAALQDAVSTDAGAVTLATLARAITRNVVDVFGPANVPSCEVQGDASVPAHIGSSIAVALNELVMNAVRHSEAQRVRVAIESTDHEVVIQVIDDGRGIATPNAAGGGLITRAVIRNELRGRSMSCRQRRARPCGLVVPCRRRHERKRPVTRAVDPWSVRGSNSRPFGCKPKARPAEAKPIASERYPASEGLPGASDQNGGGAALVRGVRAR